MLQESCESKMHRSYANKSMLTNRQLSFQNSCVIKTGLSDFHKMTVAMLNFYIK